MSTIAAATRVLSDTALPRRPARFPNMRFTVNFEVHYLYFDFISTPSLQTFSDYDMRLL
jgi:hypothetical protein